ncbi:MAG: PaaI family thioesterase [bacterium]|nr:PaaI family thioesterase [bacterium]
MFRCPGSLDDDVRARVIARFEAVPLMKTIGVRLDRLARGECDLALDRRPDLNGIFESLHGGILTTLADSAVAFAGLTLIDPDEIITTIEFNTRFMAPCREGVVAKSRVIKMGRTLMTGEIDLMGTDSGSHVAVCGVTYMRLKG